MSTDPTSITNMSTGTDALLDQAKRLHLAETLVEVSRTTAALDSLDEVLASLVAMTAAALRAERATLFLNDATTNELYSRSMTEHGPARSGCSTTRASPAKSSRPGRASSALENATLFDDVQRVKNYNDAVLESMTNGVVTLDNEGQVVTCNAAGAEILGYEEHQIVGRSVHDLFSKNQGILALVEDVMATSESGSLMDVDIHPGVDERPDAVSVNVTGVPLRIETRDEGTILLLENISSEKRVRSTMARYMDPALADRLVRSGEDILGGTSAVVSLLFSDIRGFTSLTEQLGPQATVSMLNEYFSLMVDCTQCEGGMLDKFIGDAIMAAFGLPTPDSDDPDRAVRTAIAMIHSLHEWNSVRAADGKPPIDMGIGVNTGAVVAGNIG